jgi:hypothetical protein
MQRWILPNFLFVSCRTVHEDQLRFREMCTVPYLRLSKPSNNSARWSQRMFAPGPRLQCTLQYTTVGPRRFAAPLARTPNGASAPDSVRRWRSLSARPMTIHRDSYPQTRGRHMVALSVATTRYTTNGHKIFPLGTRLSAIGISQRLHRATRCENALDVEPLTGTQNPTI